MTDSDSSGYDADRRLRDVIARQPYPLIFATISGAHLYGFPSPDSDYDLRGCHVLPVSQVVGLDRGQETIEWSAVDDRLEIDLVTHDAAKFFDLMLRKNGYVLEQLYSPLVVHETAEHEELKVIGQSCVTRHHYHHYRGFAETQWRLFEKERPPRVKPLLYVYRVLLTGINLMRTGRIKANLIRAQRRGPALSRRRPGRAETGRTGGWRPERWRHGIPPARVRATCVRARSGAPGEQFARRTDGPACPQRSADQVADANARQVESVKDSKKNGRAAGSATSISETKWTVRENASWPVRRRERCPDT